MEIKALFCGKESELRGIGPRDGGASCLTAADDKSDVHPDMRLCSLRCLEAVGYNCTLNCVTCLKEFRSSSGQLSFIFTLLLMFSVALSKWALSTLASSEA